LLSIVGIKIDMATLEKRAKDTEMLIKTIEQQMAGRSGRLQEGQQTPPPSKSPNMGYIS
jgi:proteasome assembly chaperone (PAC2) family protein